MTDEKILELFEKAAMAGVVEIDKRFEGLDRELRHQRRALWVLWGVLFFLAGHFAWEAGRAAGRASDRTRPTPTASSSSSGSPGAAAGNPEVARRTALAYVRELYPNQENQTASCNCEGLSRRQCSNRGEGWCWCSFGNPPGTRLIFNICCDGKASGNEGCWP